MENGIGRSDIMKILKRIAIAFSLYSRIPMPVFEWEDEDYKGAIAFLPLVGAVIGAVIYGLLILFHRLDIIFIVRMLIVAVVPIIITGGFHLDGYMDVSDALSSYQGKERCLEIMKDPHIGAFAVIALVKYGVLYLASLIALMDVMDEKFTLSCQSLYFLSFFIVRAMCGITSIYMKKAKSDGMLNNETRNSGVFTKAVLFVFLAAAVIYSIVLNPLMGVVAFAALLLYTLRYWILCKKRFGGVTGDTAGYYICQGELVYIAVLAIASNLYFLYL